MFYWSEKQETTHTWYGLFRDGLRTESIDVMQRFWTGQWPENRSPAVRSLAIDGFTNPRSVYLEPRKTYRAHVEVADPDSDPLFFEAYYEPILHKTVSELGLQLTANDYEDWGGRGEKWLRGDEGWYFILPDGSLHRWNGKSGANGPYVENLGSEVHCPSPQPGCRRIVKFQVRARCSHLRHHRENY